MNVDPKQFEQMCKDVTDIKRAVLGDKEYRQPGLMKRVEELERWKGWLMLKLALVTGGALAIWGALKQWLAAKS